MLWRLQSAAHASLPGGAEDQLQSGATGLEFKLCRSQQFALRNYLMISFVSSHGHRGLLATEERRRRLAEAGVRRKPRLKQGRRGAFVGKVKDVDGCELKRMKLGIRAWCEFQGRPWRVRRSRRAILTPRCFIPPKPHGFRPSGTCLLALCAPIV